MQRFFLHLEHGGVLVMPFLILRRGDTPPDGEWSEWHKVADRQREDGALVRRWQRMKFDDGEQLEHTEDRYEVIVGGRVIKTEEHRRTPAVRWYTQPQSLALFARAGFADVRALSGFTFEPGSEGDPVWTICGTRP
jgi:hypothetical protein